MTPEEQLEQEAQMLMAAPAPSSIEEEAEMLMAPPSSQLDEEAAMLQAAPTQEPIQEEEEDSTGELFLEGLMRAAKQEIIPFAVSDEEIKEMKEEELSGAKMAGEAIGGLGTGMAAAIASAKAGGALGAGIGSLFGGIGAVPGSAIGSLIGGGLGAATYAIYSGFGQEHIMSELADQEFSPGRAIARSALQLNPIAKIEGRAAQTLQSLAPRLVKAAQAAGKSKAVYARAAAQIAGEAGVAADTFGKDAGIFTALISTLISPMMVKGMKSSPILGSVEDLDNYLKTPVGQALSMKAADRIAKEIPQEVNVKKALKDDRFLQYVLTRPGKSSSGEDAILKASPKTRQARIQRLMSKENDQGGLTENKIAEMYKGYLSRNIMMDEASKARKAIEKEFVKNVGLKSDRIMDEPFGDIANWLGDGQLIARATDRKFGTSTTSLLNELAERKGTYEVEAGKLFNKGIDAVKKQRKLGFSNEEIGRLRVFLSEKSAKPEILPDRIKPLIDLNSKRIKDPKLQEVVNLWDDAFESARNSITSRDFDVNKIPHYMPMKLIPKDTLPIQIRRSLQRIGGLARSAGKDDLFKLKREDLKKMGLAKAERRDVYEELTTMKRLASSFYGIPAGEVTEQKLGGLIQDMLKSGKAKPGLGYELSAMFSRGGSKISDKYRDLDIGSAYTRYVQSQVRGAIMDDVNRKLLDNVEILKATGASKAAAWWEDHMLDMIAGRQTPNFKIANLMQDSKNKYRYWVDKSADDMGLANDALGRKGVKQMGEALSTWQSMLYPAYLGLNVRANLRNLTQVGALTAPELGGTYGYKTAARAYAKMAASIAKGKSLSQELDDLGLGGSRFLAEKLQADVKELPTVGAAKVLNNATMAIYSYSDVINRAATYRMGQIMAKDLLSGDKQALKALKKMGSATRANLQKAGVREAIQARDADKLGDILGKSLVAKTQFHYGPEQRARYARFMGPMFSMFTKWPVSVGSNIVDVWQENPKAYQKLKRYMELYGAPLGVLSALGYGMKEYEGEHGVLNYLIGDPKEISPALALEFTLFQNPAVEALGEGKEQVRRAMASDKDFSENAADLTKKLTKKAMTTAIPPVSSVINEVERFQKKAMGEKKTSFDETLEDIFGK